MFNLLLEKVYLLNKFAIIEVENEDDQILLSMAVNRAGEMKDVFGSVIISKNESSVIVKIRSSDKLNSKVFIEEFGGGGHARQAAAEVSHMEIPQILEKIKNYEW